MSADPTPRPAPARFTAADLALINGASWLCLRRIRTADPDSEALVRSVLAELVGRASPALVASGVPRAVARLLAAGDVERSFVEMALGDLLAGLFLPRFARAWEQLRDEGRSHDRRA